MKTNKALYSLFYKQHLYKQHLYIQRQAEISKKLNKS